MIKYPFLADGVVYFGWLAKAYLTGFSGFWEVYKTQQAPIYFGLQMAVAQIFGFSYQGALFVQCLACLGLIFIISEMTSNTTSRRSTLFLLFGFLFASGIFQFKVGGLFDFRIDLWGSLVLTIGLLGLRKNLFLSAILVAVAVSERFHNLSVLGITAVILAGFSLYQSRNSKFERKHFNPVISVSLAFVILALVRTEYLLGMWKMYQTHLNIGSSETFSKFMFSGPWEPGFWDFYLKSLLESYFRKNVFVISLFLIVAVVLTKFRAYLNGVLFTVSPLLVGAVVALILLHINFARNNEGVLRYFLVPAVLGIAIMCAYVVDKNIYRNKVLLILPLFVCIFGSGVGVFYLAKTFSEIDYKGLQTKRVDLQMDTAHQKILEYLVTRNISVGKIAATFHSDYGLSDLYPWAIYKASHDLFDPGAELKEVFGSDLFYNGPSPILDRISTADIIVFGEDSCRSGRVPLNQQLNEISKLLEAEVRSRCKFKIANLDFDCKAEILGCERQYPAKE